jgi:hypothetical protein
MRIDLTKMQVSAIVTMLRDELGEDDDRLLLDTLEGETDLFELVGRLLNQIEAEEGTVLALKGQIDDRTARKQRSEQRKESHRNAILALMEAARQEKLLLPEATLSVRTVAPKPIFPNVDLVPDEFCKFDRKLDREKLKSVDPSNLPSWATMDNGGTSLTIRRK